jgi:hypothetical protein
MIFALLALVFGWGSAAILMMSFVCETDDSVGTQRYELMVAAGMVRSRLVSQGGGASIRREASKVLTPAELAEVRQRIARLPSPIVDGVRRSHPSGYAGLHVVAGDMAWNVSYAPSDRRWQDFQPLLQWIEEIRSDMGPTQ